MTRPIRCLHCSQTLDLPLRTSQTCPGCGAINLREDLRIYRTLRPAARRLEAGLKGLVVVLLGGFTALMLLAPGGMHGYHGVGYSIGFPILMALILWDTIGLVTRRHSVLRMEVFWPAFLAAIVLGPVLVFLVLGVGVMPIDGSWWIGPIALAAFVGFFGARVLRAARPWRRRRPRRP